MTAIATQERRVLELKEELQRAEADLLNLKRQWAQHEANKKRNDARRVTRLQPVQTAPSVNDQEEDADGSSAWMQQQMERRKALLGGGRNSNRTVFSGSRHTRTLSLLSPTLENGGKPAFAPRPLPPRRDSLKHSPKKIVEEPHDQRRVRPALIARASTTPDLTTEMAETAETSIDLFDNLEKGLDHELLRTGQNVVNGLKDGLWTFFEDLRAATVGDEAIQHATVVPTSDLRKQSSTQTLRTAKKASKSSCLLYTSPSPRD